MKHKCPHNRQILKVAINVRIEDQGQKVKNHSTYRKVLL
jgi:hypothetical protein